MTYKEMLAKNRAQMPEKEGRYLAFYEYDRAEFMHFRDYGDNRYDWIGPDGHAWRDPKAWMEIPTTFKGKKHKIA
jgi:hypothetical protein